MLKVGWEDKAAHTTLCFYLKSLLGQAVDVQLTSGRTLAGTLVDVDGHMKCALRPRVRPGAARVCVRV